MNKNKQIIFIVVVGIFIWLLLLRVLLRNTGTICIIRGVFGIPCPTCGITRAIKSFINFNIKDAIYYNPVFFMPFLIVLITIFKRKYLKVIATLSAITFIIVYIFRMTLYFPYKEPMQINKESIIMKIINF